MIRTWLKTAFRNLIKYKFTSFINLLGLAIGMCCCLLILSFILNELSYDRYNKKADQIYRVTRSFNNQNGVVSLRLGSIAPAFGPYLVNDFPEIRKMTRLLQTGSISLRYRENLFNETDLFFADKNLFDVFTVQVESGNPATALAEPNTIMLTREMAEKYFGHEDPMNKVVRLNNQLDLKVTGIYKRFPANAHLHPDALISFPTLNDTAVYGEENLRTSWSNNAFFTYLLLPENYPARRMVSQFPAFVDRHLDPKLYGTTPSLFTRLDLQKLTDIHLHSKLDYEIEPNGDITRVYVFSLIALFILIIACINYMNLSTARSALRAREIGIRKVIGAGRKELVFQFLSESVVTCILALLIALLLTSLSLPWLSRISGQELSFQQLSRWQVILPLFLSPLLIGLLSGIYPALFISSFQPVKTLKGFFKTGGSGVSFRKVLVVTQFSISIILIISTAVVFQQLHYMQTKSLGFDKNQVVILPYAYGRDMDKRYESFRTALLQNPAFKEVSRSSRIPTGRLLDASGASTLSGDSLHPVTTDIKVVNVDYDFIPVYGIQLLAGRNFSRDFATDTAGFILNESAVRAVGWKTAQDAVGRPFKYGGQYGRVIGVARDFNFESLHEKIAPLVLTMQPQGPEPYRNISVKMVGANPYSALNDLEKTWKTILPETPYQYNFLDDNFTKLYRNEQRQGAVFIVFSGIAIFIACLGLFGLSAFAISLRVKEIGVRKVLGAQVQGIVVLLANDFLKLVLLAALLAFPIAWYAMNKWLGNFAYRITIQWWVFLLAAILAALIAFITISFQAIKAANANPVKSLRAE